MKKTYVLDTNVLLSDPRSIFAFEDNDVIIPMITLEELDSKKDRPDEVGRNAREISRQLDSLQEQGDFRTGISLRNGGTLFVQYIKSDILQRLPPELANVSYDKSSVDNMLIAFLQQKTDIDSSSDTILVSKDINVRLKCKALGLKAEDYENAKIVDTQDQLYTGVTVVPAEKETVDKFYVEGCLTLEETEQKIYPNQIIVLKNVDNEGNSHTALAKHTKDGVLKPLKMYEHAFGLKPRNKEQRFALDLLMDVNVKLLTMTGISGSGKTCLALAAGLEQLKGLGHNGRYNKLIVTKPVQPVGKDIGFLPGTLQEKMEPWIAPIRDNLNFLMSTGTSKKLKASASDKDDQGQRFVKKDTSYLELMQEKGLIEVEAITFIRGRSIPDAFIIIDETQNLSVHELKTIITRAGDNTKIVLTGDIEQIDNAQLDMFTNGLTHVIEKFKDQDIAAHIKFLKGERSELASIASQIL